MGDQQTSPWPMEVSLLGSPIHIHAYVCTSLQKFIIMATKILQICNSIKTVHLLAVSIDNSYFQHGATR